AGLEWASNLTCLSLESNLISSVSSLENLKGLTSLSLAENALTEISPLGGLTNLEILSLRGNYISNAAAVTNLARLISLELSYNLLDLRHGSSSMELIDNLLKEEVRVVYLPQRGALTILSRSNWVIPVNTTCMMGFSIFQNGQPNG